MKVVLDTNVLVAAFTTHGLCYEVVEQCLRRKCIVISDYIAEELERILRDKFEVPKRKIQWFLRYLRQQCQSVKPSPVTADCCDKNDLPVLGTLMAAKADILVAGDKGLLELDNFNGCPILSPREFYENYLK